MKLNSRKIVKKLLYTLYLFTTVAIILEIAYRNYWVDFYAPELLGLNDPAVLESKKEHQKTILFLGDSFTAAAGNYVQQLRGELKDYQLINSAVPGSGIQETTLLAATRIRHFRPDIVVYQIYTGNDLTDIRHPINWSTLSPARNIYWFVSDRLLIADYINFRLANWKHSLYDDLREAEGRNLNGTFHPDLYSAREKMLFRADPYLVDNTIQLTSGRQGDFDCLLEGLDDLVNLAGDSCQVILLVIPHCMQTNIYYRDNMLQIGAKSTLSAAIFDAGYPFFQKLSAHFQRNERVKVLNPLAELRRRDAPGQRVYYENDPHLSPAGQEIMRDILLSYLGF